MTTTRRPARWGLVAWLLVCGAWVPRALAQAGEDTCPGEDLGVLSGPGTADPAALAGTANTFGAPSAAECPLPCSDWGSGNDVIYTFEVAELAAWTFQFCELNTVFFEGSMQIRGGGACPGDVCLDADDGGCTDCLPNPVGPGVSVTATLTPGNTYWLIVDAKTLYDPEVPQSGGIWSLSWDLSGFCGDETLDPGEQCDPPDGVTCDENCQFINGNDCAEPIPVDLQQDLPFVDSGQTTCQRGNDYDDGTCISGIQLPEGNANYTAGEDLIYELITTETVCINVSLTTSGQWPGLAIDDVCPPDLNCLATALGGQSADPPPIDFLELPPGTYYLLVDNWAPPACLQDLALSISACPTAGACCVDDICSDDVEEVDCTGRSFPGQTCADLEFCPPPNDLCDEATAVGEGVFDFTTVGALPEPDSPDACTFPLSDDVWFHYTATFSGTALVDTCGLANDGQDSIMQIYQGCDCPPTGETLACEQDHPGCGQGSFASLAVVDVLQGGCYTIRLSGFFDLPVTGELAIAPFSCTSTADCADILPADGVRDDGCVYWACVDGFCSGFDIVYADMSGFAGACEPDGTADINDFFQSLNCFANVNTMGEAPFPCEESPPLAFNVDAARLGEPCLADGVCDINDSFAALNAFGGMTTCSCPMAPAPQAPGAALRKSGSAALTLRPASPVVRPGALFEVHVYLQSPLRDLRGYQLRAEVRGGGRGSLLLEDIVLHGAGGGAYVFAGRDDWRVFNRHTAQIGAGLFGPGQGAAAGSYLATFVYRVSDDAAGIFVIDVLPRGPSVPGTFLLPTPEGAGIEISGSQPAVVSVHALGAARKRRR